MLCTRCGNLVPEGSSFCNTCGMTTPATAPGNVAPPTPHWQDLFTEPKTDGKAIASLVFGCFFFLFPSAVLAVILGHLSLSEIRKSAGGMKGKGLAIGGLVLGYLGVAAIPILFLVLIVSLIPNLTHARVARNEASAISSIRALNASEIGFARSHPDIGFTCRLDDLVGSGGIYGWSDPVLASGQKNGYVFVVQNCAAGKGGGPNSKYQITGYPLQQSGLRTFCSDQSAVIRYEFRGTPQNCLEHGPSL